MTNSRTSLMRRARALFFGLLAAARLGGCGGGDDGEVVIGLTEPNQTSLQLVFQSGYESNVSGTPSDAYQSIAGADLNFTEINNWKDDLGGHPKVDNFFIYYEGGNSSQRFAKITTDPTNTANKALHYWLDEAYITYGNNKLKGRIQATIDANQLYEMSMSHKLLLPEDMNALVNTTETFGWLTVQEFWNDLVESDYPFRISVNIVKPNTTPGLYFQAHGQTKRANEEAWDDVWTQTDSSFSIPINEWFTVETYFKEGNQNIGRFKMTVTNKSGEKFTVIDVTNYTYHPRDPSPDGLNKLNPMKLYAPDRIINPMKQSGKTLQLYWDDFKLWL